MTNIDAELEKFAKDEIADLLYYVRWDVVAKDVADITSRPEVEEYMFELENEAEESVATDIDYKIMNYDVDDLYAWVKSHLNNDNLNDKIEDASFYTDHVKDLQSLEEAYSNGEYLGEVKTILNHILFFSLTEVDYLTSEPFIEDITHGYSWVVCEKVGLIDKYY